MKVTAIGITPPPTAIGTPSVTPELLASCLAKYSRSNKGIDHILSSINWSEPDKSVDAIFKFVDYGHASIGGLTGGIPIAIDGCSLLLAYKIFEIAQLCDGQESSTRYIQLSSEGIMTPEEVGIPLELAQEWRDCMEEAFEHYHQLYRKLDEQAQKNPEVVRVPAGAGEKVADRLRKNYALDRARYLIPMATKTNAAYVMSARVWAQTIRQLDALPWREAQQCSALLRAELNKFTPRLTRHSIKDEASIAQAMEEVELSRNYIITHGVSTENIPDEVFLSVEGEYPSFLGETQRIDAAFAGKRNRYSVVGPYIKRRMVRFGWNNIALAELRDLNRHRSGCRYTPLFPVGFYLPKEVKREDLSSFLLRAAKLTRSCTEFSENGAHLYCYFLGTQVPFEHSTHLDKLIYEIELRTGLGAHFRYAEHLAAISARLTAVYPELESYIEVGTAEPE